MITKRTRRRAGFSMIEVVLASAVVGVMLVAALNVVGASAVAQARTSDRARGMGLASALMSEITASSYEDSGAVVLFGPEAPEVIAGRPSFDDVDDYAGYKDDPPSDRSGNKLSGVEGWTRQVRVRWVSVSGTVDTSLIETGVKEITVTAFKGTYPAAELVALRTKAR